MKKVIAVFLSILLLSQIAYASDIDLKNISTEDLIKLKTSIMEELMDRGEQKSAQVPAGEYTIGTDIPAGSYSLSTDQIVVTVTVNGYEQMFVITPDDSVGKITLNDGDIFTNSSTIVMEKYSGITFE